MRTILEIAQDLSDRDLQSWISTYRHNVRVRRMRRDDPRLQEQEELLAMCIAEQARREAAKKGE
jgi:hypothetical protein